jgi:hypothetical protein
MYKLDVQEKSKNQLQGSFIVIITSHICECLQNADETLHIQVPPPGTMMRSKLCQSRAQVFRRRRPAWHLRIPATFRVDFCQSSLTIRYRTQLKVSVFEVPSRIQAENDLIRT